MSWSWYLCLAYYFILAACIYRCSKGRLTATYFTFGQITLTGLGICELSLDAHAAAINIGYLLGVSMFVLGYCFYYARNRDIRKMGTTCKRSSVLLGQFYFAYIIVGILCIYHFFVIGIPILSDQLETARFQLVDSGLWGLPGRSVLFGSVILLAIAIGITRFNSLSRHKTLWIWGLAIVPLFTTRIMLGFKSAILEVVFIVTVCLCSNYFENLFSKAIRILLPWIGFSVIFAIQAAKLYETVQGGYDSAAVYLWRRATVIAADPGFRVLMGDIYPPDGGKSILREDVEYYLKRYLGFDYEGSYPFVKIVSANISQMPLEGEGFLVPVTVGAIPSLLFEFDYFGFILIALLGILAATLERHVEVSKSPMSFALHVIAIIALNGYMTKGDLIYNVINWGIMFAFVWAIMKIGRVAHNGLFLNKANAFQYRKMVNSGTAMNSDRF